MTKLVVALKNIIVTFSSTKTVVNKLILGRILYHMDFIYQDPNRIEKKVVFICCLARKKLLLNIETTLVKIC